MFVLLKPTGGQTRDFTLPTCFVKEPVYQFCCSLVPANSGTRSSSMVRRSSSIAASGDLGGIQKLLFAQKVIQHPVTILFNILVLVATLYHAFTWFNLMPKAQRVIIKNKLLDGKYFVIALYALTILVTIFGAVCFFTDFLWIFLK